MKSSKVLSAFLALLLMANLSFAQNAKMKKNISAKARYEKILAEISGHKSVRKDRAVYFVGLPASVGATYLTFGNASAVVAAGGATLSTGGIALLLVTVGSIAYGGKACEKRDACFSGKDQGKQYPGIAQALTDGKVFSKYSVVLTNTGTHPSEPHLTQHALSKLENFLAHPYNMVLVEKLSSNQEGDYRFYFDFPKGHPELANRNIYADVDMEIKAIIVRSDGIRQAGDRDKSYIKAKKKKK